MILKNASLVLIIGFAFYCLWNKLTVSRRIREEQAQEDNFWKREREANSVRRKPIDHLDYIEIPDNLYFNLLPDNPELDSIKATIDELRVCKILNLTGYTNTDLKIMYGTANITDLSLYDQNYTSLVTTLQKWADILLGNNYENEAIEIMEFLISTNADIGRTYRILGQYYKKAGRNEDFDALLKRASELKSLNSSHIVESLEMLDSIV